LPVIRQFIAVFLMARRHDLLLQLLTGSVTTSELMIDGLDRRKHMYGTSAGSTRCAIPSSKGIF
jgi:hypothetical protein